MMTPPFYYIYQEFEETIEMLSDEDAGILIKAMSRYVFYGEIPEFLSDKEKPMAYSWPLIVSKLNRDKKKYAEECVKHAYAGDMKGKSEEEKLSYKDWFEWRVARYRPYTDPILEGFTIEDMMIFDSQKARKRSNREID